MLTKSQEAKVIEKIFLITIFNHRTGQINVHKTTNPNRVNAVRKTARHFTIVTQYLKDGAVMVEEHDWKRPCNQLFYVDNTGKPIIMDSRFGGVTQ